MIRNIFITTFVVSSIFVGVAHADTLPISPGTAPVTYGCISASTPKRYFCRSFDIGSTADNEIQARAACQAITDCATACVKMTEAQCATTPPTSGGNTGSPPGGNTGAPAGNTGLPPGRDLTIQSIYGIILGLTCWLTRISLLLIIAFLMWYGFLFLKAQGDPGKVGDAKKAFGWGIVGVIVILGTYSIIATVAGTVGGGDVTISPIPINCSAF